MPKTEPGTTRIGGRTWAEYQVRCKEGEDFFRGIAAKIRSGKSKSARSRFAHEANDNPEVLAWRLEHTALLLEGLLWADLRDKEAVRG